MSEWRHKVGKDLLQLVEERSRTTRLRVLVQHNCGETLPHVIGHIKVIKTMPLIGAFCAELTPMEIGHLAKQQEIRFISSDRIVTTCMNIARPAAGADVAQSEGLIGDGIGVAVIDSGIYPHPDVEGAIDSIVDFTNGQMTPRDLQGHGTHVSGIILGRGRVNPAFTGIAPGARLISLRVFGTDNVTTLGRLIEALSWVHANATRFNIRVVNMSLGAPPVESFDMDPLCQAAKILWEKGILLVVAAGNEGSQGSSSVRTPGSCPYVVTVGAIDDRRTISRTDDTFAPFSSQGPTPDGLTKPDVVAPGVDIISLRAIGSTLDRQLPQNRVGEYYFRLSGTSMATPMVSGLAAILLQKRPDLSPDEVKAALTSTAEDRGLLARRQGTGYVQAMLALRFLPGPQMFWQGTNLKIRLH